MIALGIDPGISGGLAIVSDDDGRIGSLIDVIDIPIVGSGPRERVEIIGVRNFVLHHQPALAVIERAGSTPRQGIASAFKYGRAVSPLEAAINLAAVPIEIVEPSVWKKHFNLPGKDKEAARQRALELFPSRHELFARKRDHGRTEAALIGLYGLRQFRPTTAPPGAQTSSINETLSIRNTTNVE